METLSVLQSMKCQTSPQYPLYRFGDPERRLIVNFGGEGGILYTLSSYLLFWQSDSQSCQAMDMALVDDNKLNVMGSFAIVWPFFVTLCISQFVDTISCALEGRQPMPETGMSTFEHSLAFAECEAMISHALGLNSFGSSKSDNTSTPKSGSSADSILLTRSMILRRLNIPSEVLLVMLISCLGHLTTSVLAITGHKRRFRFVNTGFFALCYMGAFIWSWTRALYDPSDDELDYRVLRFPTVCIIGFIPHIMILIGITVCGIVYGLALLVTAVALPPDAPVNPSIKERFVIAFRNLQANVQFSTSSSIKLNWQEDFYTALLKIGFSILTAASEAVYLNEGNRVRISEMTWLEEKRLKELTASVERRRALVNVPPELLEDRIASGLEYTDHDSTTARSGYARERKSRTVKDNNATGGIDSGLGLAERRSRWMLMLAFMKGIGLLFGRFIARALLRLLDALKIHWKPQILVRYADFSVKTSSKPHIRQDDPALRNLMFVDTDGDAIISTDGQLDVEREYRKRLYSRSGQPLEGEVLDTELYRLWKTGGWWGDADASGDYDDDANDDDTTSVASMSTNHSDEWSDVSDSGRRTPTQEDFPQQPDNTERTFRMSDLARLLDPKTLQDREEARILSRHLQSERPVTRRQYEQQINRDKHLVLFGPRSRQAKDSPNNLAAEFDEEQAVEQFIVQRRARATQATSEAGSWSSGAAGMGSGGPQCVVCQSSPRVILVWPCGCLSICDECRLGVATRNFSSCLCCRTNVVAYSKLYVP